jgi:hypothetical protein
MYDTPPPGPLAANAASRLAANNRRGPHNGSRRLDPVPAPVPMPAAPPGTRIGVAQLRRFQWAVRAALTVGVAASVCANVLHARDNPISQTIAAWPPLALLLTVELVSRVPVYRRSLAAVRILATTAIAGIAAFVSYWHMATVAARYGESGLAPYLLPLSVDGLIVVGSVSLVELAGRVRAALDGKAVPEGQPAPPAAVAAKPPAFMASTDTAESAPDEPPTNRGDSHNGHQPLTLLPAPDLEPVSISAPADADPDLVALLPAARAARDELGRHGRSLTRDSLAAQLRRDGHTIRTSRVSELLTLLRNDTPATANGRASQRGRVIGLRLVTWKCVPEHGTPIPAARCSRQGSRHPRGPRTEPGPPVLDQRSLRELGWVEVKPLAGSFFLGLGGRTG